MPHGIYPCAPDQRSLQTPVRSLSAVHGCDCNPDNHVPDKNVPYPETSEKYCHTSTPELPDTSGTVHCYNEVPAFLPPDGSPAFHHKKPIYLPSPHMADGCGTQDRTPVHVHTYKSPLILSKIQAVAAADAVHKYH